MSQGSYDYLNEGGKDVRDRFGQNSSYSLTRMDDLPTVYHSQGLVLDVMRDSLTRWALALPAAMYMRGARW